jgi:hypothetical protein
MRYRTGENIHVGDRVVCNREAPAHGTWSRFAGRKGWVAVVKTSEGEIGVSWSRREDMTKAEADAWFLPTELLQVADAR